MTEARRSARSGPRLYTSTSVLLLISLTQKVFEPWRWGQVMQCALVKRSSQDTATEQISEVPIKHSYSGKDLKCSWLRNRTRPLQKPFFTEDASCSASVTGYVEWWTRYLVVRRMASITRAFKIIISIDFWLFQCHKVKNSYKTSFMKTLFQKY